MSDSRRPRRRIFVRGPWRAIVVAAALVVSGRVPRAAAQEPAPAAGGHPDAPAVAPASPDARKAMAGFQLAKDMRVDLFAAEPLLANPVAFGFDEKGRVFVVETFRLHHGVTDTRGHMNWLDDDLACRTIADRLAMYRKYLGKTAADYAVEHDRLRLVVDRDGDGQADAATVFADGFNKMEDGLAAGVLAHKGYVYFSCIPDLWVFRDDNGDGRADRRKSLASGFGVHVGFLGHDLHGLIFGPDGRLYFSIGDRGLNVRATDGRTLFLPDTGAVLRCEPDGSKLEIFATGLRNPQELAFDDFGNLFTVDNNSDGGDRARLTYILPGGDHGWTMGWQYIERPNSRGAWNSDRLWHPAFVGQAAHIVPPLANLADGPSGLVYHPGVARLPERYAGHFFLADFRGAAGQSGVRAFTVKPRGAGFTLDRSEQFVWGLEATDVDFGPDGALYVSDWVEGWNTTGKGRLYRFQDPSRPAGPAAEVRDLLARGFDGLKLDELAALLSHADRRVRQAAQFALALKGDGATPVLVAIARRRVDASVPAADQRRQRLGRVHAIWTLGQRARVQPSGPRGFDQLLPLLDDPDAEIRAQVARVLGDEEVVAAGEGLIARLRDPSARVRSLAALALGRVSQVKALGPLPAFGPLLELLRDNADQDPYLRHAAVMGLVGSWDETKVPAALGDASAPVRLGVLLAMRRRRDARIERFLGDAEPRLVTEAARAIYDVPIDGALPALATLTARPAGSARLSEPAWRRAVNAAGRVGRGDDARALAALAVRKDVPESIRTECVELLARWPKPAGRDRVTGLWRPGRDHAAADAAAALAPVYEQLLAAPAAVRNAAIKAAGPLPIASAATALARVFHDPQRLASTRVEALMAIERLHDAGLPTEGLPALAAQALGDGQASVRVEGRRLLAKLDPARAVPALASVLESGTVDEKQGAFATLATLPEGPADAILADWLDRLARRQVAPEVALDLLDAARTRKASAVVSKLAAHEAARPKDDPLSAYFETLAGGNPARGEAIVRTKAEAQCLRCHKLRGNGGEVGPELSGVASRGDRRYILESIALPNRQIAKGFETLLVATNDGQVHTGILKKETDASLELISADGKPIIVAKDQVEERKRGASAMPDDLIKSLSRAELRDLIAFLSTLK